MLKNFLLALAFVFLSMNSTADIWMPSPPDISAKSYILIDYHSGRTIAGNNMDDSYDPASLTKLMTAYVVYHSLAKGIVTINDLVTISTKAWQTKGSRTFVEVGTKVPFSVLLSGMVIQSGNDASIALAEHITGSESAFVEIMNLHAQKLGMKNSYFQNVTGLPNKEHKMSARDIAILSRAIIQEFPGHYQMYSQKEYTYNNINQRNRNRLLWRNLNVDGLKTGYTQAAKYCLAASAKREDMRLISVILNDGSEDSRFRSTSELLRYGFRFYDSAQLVAADESVAVRRAWGGKPDHVQIGVLDDVYAIFPKNAKDKIQTKFIINNYIDAPVEKHTPVGKIQVYLENKLLQEKPLVTLNTITEGNIFTRISDKFLRLFE